MCEAVGHRGRALERVAFGPLRLGDAARQGGHRPADAPREVERLRRAG